MKSKPSVAGHLFVLVKICFHGRIVLSRASVSDCRDGEMVQQQWLGLVPE